MPDKKPALDYKKLLWRFAEQGNVEVLKAELKALQKERRYLPICEPLMIQVKEWIETAKERKKNLQQQQEEEEQVKKLREARESFLPLMERIAKILAETREDRVQGLLKDEKMSEYIDRLVDEENADRPEDDKVSREDVVRELVFRSDQAIKTVFYNQIDKNHGLALEEAVPEAKRLVQENQENLWQACLPVLTPSCRPVLSKKHDESDELKKLMGFMFLTAGVAVVAVPKDIMLATQKQNQLQDLIRQVVEPDSNRPLATPTPRPH